VKEWRCWDPELAPKSGGAGLEPSQAAAGSAAKWPLKEGTVKTNRRANRVAVARFTDVLGNDAQTKRPQSMRKHVVAGKQ